MNRDKTNLLGFFKIKLNELCIYENRSYTEEEIEMLKQLEELELDNKEVKLKKTALQKSKNRLEKKYILLRHEYKLSKKKEYLKSNED